MKKILILLTLLPIILLTSCSKTQVGWVGNNYGNTFNASYILFDGQERERIQLDAGDVFTLSYNLSVEDGALSLQITDPDKAVIWEETFLEDDEGDFSFTPQGSGRYILTITGDQAEGGFDLTWDVSE